MSPGFGIVGVNGGSPFTPNKCLDHELAWADGALNDNPAFYANTGDAGPTYAAAWPISQGTPEVCRGANSVACSYDYGWNAARSSFENAVIAEGDDGSANPTLSARSAPWWLDVETGNAWETIEYGRTAATETYDRVMLEGEVASFAKIGVTSLGIYSTSSHVAGDHRRLRIGVLDDSRVDPRLRHARGGRSSVLHDIVHGCARRDDPVPVPGLRRRLRCAACSPAP